MLIDAHVHLDKYEDEQIGEVLEEIERLGILTMSVSVDPESFRRTESIARICSLVVPAFGIHPEEAPQHADDLDAVEHLVERSPMVGEIGLDHRFVTDADQYDAQRRVFARLLDLAVDLGKLVNLHTAGAEQETLSMLTERGVDRVIVHWYSGPLDVLTRMIDAGYMFTVGVEVRHSDHVREVARLIPDDSLLTETDNPGGLAWVTGERGRPSHLADVVEELAELRGLSEEDLRSLVRANLDRLLTGDAHLESWRSLLE